MHVDIVPEVFSVVHETICNYDGGSEGNTLLLFYLIALQ